MAEQYLLYDHRQPGGTKNIIGGDCVGCDGKDYEEGCGIYQAQQEFLIEPKEGTLEKGLADAHWVKKSFEYNRGIPI